MRRILIALFLLPLLNAYSGEAAASWIGIWKHESMNKTPDTSRTLEIETGRLVIEKESGDLRFHFKSRISYTARGSKREVDIFIDTDDQTCSWYVNGGLTDSKEGSAKLISSKFNERGDVLKITLLLSNEKADFYSEEKSYYFFLFSHTLFTVTKAEANLSQEDILESVYARLRAQNAQVWKLDKEF